jgi:hypothetical protein
MSGNIRLSAELVQAAEVVARHNQRTTAGQIEFWVRLGRASEENPDLSSQLLQDLLVGIEDINQGKTRTYRFK